MLGSVLVPSEQEAGNETQRPEDKGKDQGNDGQHKGGDQVEDIATILGPLVAGTWTETQ